MTGSLLAPEPAVTQVRLRRLTIRNFRAIAEAVIDFEDTVALVGQNGAGKTSILRALNAFFNFEEEKHGRLRYCPTI